MHNIWHFMSKNKYISVAKISKILNVSESTIRRKVDILNEVLKQTKCGYIEKLPSKGLHLEIINQEEINRLYASYEMQNLITGEDLIYKYLFVILSASNKRLTLNELSEKLYDSIPVVKKNILICTEWLSLFDLTLEIKKNVGIVILGSEENIRLAIKHIVVNNDVYTFEESLKNFSSETYLGLLKECINDIEKEWNFKFTEASEPLLSEA